MSNNKRSRAAPAAALLAVALYALWLWRCTEPHFALGDDYYLARAFAGEVGSVAETYNAYIHTVFAWLLHGLTLAFPGVWWFSWLQMALLMLGLFGVLLGLTRGAERCGLPGYAGFAAGLLFWAAFVMEFSVAVTFTTTAAALGAGAVCLLGGVDLRASGRALAAPFMGSLSLLWCAGMLRSFAVLPALAFWLGLLILKAMPLLGPRKRGPRTGQGQSRGEAPQTVDESQQGGSEGPEPLRVHSYRPALPGGRGVCPLGQTIPASIGGKDRACASFFDTPSGEAPISLSIKCLSLCRLRDGKGHHVRPCTLNPLPPLTSRDRPFFDKLTSCRKILLRGLFRQSDRGEAPIVPRSSRLPRPLLRLLALALAVTGLLIGVRAAENALTPAEDGYRAFLDATVEPIDYGGLNRVSPQTLQEIGWTEKEAALVRSWYFLDENMSAANFARIAEDAEAQEKAPLAQRLKDGGKTVLTLLRKSPNVRGFLLICLGLCAAAFLAACLGERDGLWPLLAPLGCAGVTLFLLFYLGFQGRLPIRAAATVLLPGTAMALVLTLDGLARCRGRRWAVLPAGAAALGCLLVACSLCADAVAFCHRPDHGDPDQCVFAEVERYAATREDALLIGDRTLGVDVRMFPDRSEGAPDNLLPMWGGWNNHSQGYRAAFAAHGLDHDGFQITDFLGDKVRLVVGEAGVSPEFLAYLEERAGGPVLPVAEYQGNGFAVYSFQ